MTTRLLILLATTCSWTCANPIGPAVSAEGATIGVSAGVAEPRVHPSEGVDALAPEGDRASSREQEPTRQWRELSRGVGLGHNLAGGPGSPVVIRVNNRMGYEAYCERRIAADAAFRVALFSSTPDGAPATYVISRGRDGNWSYSLWARGSEASDVDPELCAACHQRREAEPLFRSDLLACPTSHDGQPGAIRPGTDTTCLTSSGPPCPG